MRTTPLFYRTLESNNAIQAAFAVDMKVLYSTDGKWGFEYRACKHLKNFYDVYSNKEGQMATKDTKPRPSPYFVKCMKDQEIMVSLCALTQIIWSVEQ